MRIEPGVERLWAIVRLTIAREGHQENRPAERTPNLARDLVTIELRQPDIDQRDVRVLAQDRVETSGSIDGVVHLVTGELEGDAQHLTGVAVVLHDDDPQVPITRRL